MERIKEIWNQLENTSSGVPGLFKVRYSETSKSDVFLGIKFPERYRMLMIRTPFNLGKDFSFRYDFKGLRFEKIYDPDDSSLILLNLILIDRQLKDIFDPLLKDIISNITEQADIKIVLKNFANRLIKWQSLFEKYGQQGLTPEEQRGLFGELFFLRKFLQLSSDYLSVLNSWIGPSNEIRDFQSGVWSIEVKTTHGNNHQKVQINNERQLDTSYLDYLILYHLSLEVRQQSGETLNQIIDSISNILITDFKSLNCFKTKLIEDGYFEIHKHLYEKTGYYVRQDQYYKVEKDFPRIEEKDLRNGVGDVKYSIVTSLCSDYILNEEDVFKIINTYG